MKTIFFITTLIIASLLSQAQLVDPVKWTIDIKPLKGGNQYEIIGTATIDPGYKLYGVNIKDGGPIKTSFNFETAENCKKFGKPVEVTPSKTKTDKFFNMEVSYFEGEAIISHKIWVTEKPAKISGYIQWMSCNDETCTPPTDEDFEFVIK